MVERIYGVYDLKAERVLNDVLFIFPNDAAASRMFVDSVRNPESTLAKHPEDFVLVSFGEFGADELSGRAVLVSNVRALLDAPILSALAVIQMDEEAKRRVAEMDVRPNVVGNVPVVPGVNGELALR